MNTQPKISVLVPCYNVERYIRQCMDSIVNQTLKDLEIICLNDGSTDNTPEILARYAENDSRIILINKPNSGYGATMNIGLKEAKGKYISIIESDDYIEPNMLETLYDKAEENMLDLTRCLYIERNEITGRDTIVNDSPHLYEVNKVFRPIEQQKIFFIAPSIWAGLYNRDFLTKNKICFLETPGASYQDTSFAFKTYASAERVMIVPEVLHNYRINSNSSVNSPSKIYFVCDEEAEIRKFAQDRKLYEGLKEVLAMRSFGSYKWNYNRLGSRKLRKLFATRWAEELRNMFDNGEITRRFFSKSRIFRLRILSWCPALYSIRRKF